MNARGVWGRVMDTLYTASDASHKARGWEVRKGRFGARRYRLNVAVWLASQRRIEVTGSVRGPGVAATDEAADLWDVMRWTPADMTPVLREGIHQGLAADTALGRREAA